MRTVTHVGSPWVTVLTGPDPPYKASMNRYAVIGVAVLAAVGVGGYGLLRPGPAPGFTPDEMTAKLDTVPRKIGPWAGVDQPVSEKALRTAEAQAHLSRAYTHETTGETVTVLVLYGEPAALGAHTPEVCYSGIGYEACGRAVKIAVPDSPAELWAGRFERNKGREVVDVVWGWGVNGVWSAADNPRFTFTNHRMIFKIYAQQLQDLHSPSSVPAVKISPFLTSFLRALDATVGAK